MRSCHAAWAPSCNKPDKGQLVQAIFFPRIQAKESPVALIPTLNGPCSRRHVKLQALFVMQ